LEISETTTEEDEGEEEGREAMQDYTIQELRNSSG